MKKFKKAIALLLSTGLAVSLMINAGAASVSAEEITGETDIVTTVSEETPEAVQSETETTAVSGETAPVTAEVTLPADTVITDSTASSENVTADGGDSSGTADPDVPAVTTAPTDNSSSETAYTTTVVTETVTISEGLHKTVPLFEVSSDNTVTATVADVSIANVEKFEHIESSADENGFVNVHVYAYEAGTTHITLTADNGYIMELTVIVKPYVTTASTTTITTASTTTTTYTGTTVSYSTSKPRYDRVYYGTVGESTECRLSMALGDAQISVTSLEESIAIVDSVQFTDNKLTFYVTAVSEGECALRMLITYTDGSTDEIDIGFHADAPMTSQTTTSTETTTTTSTTTDTAPAETVYTTTVSTHGTEFPVTSSSADHGSDIEQLPQTGMSPAYRFIFGTSVFITLSGAAVMLKSRKE